MNPTRALLVLVVAFGALLLAFVGGLWLVVDGSGPVSSSRKPRVGVVEVAEAITDSKEVVERLRAFVEQDGIKAIVVRVDSPGGSVGPSQEIRSEIIRARKKKKVVASLGSVAASGGFYVAIGCDRVVSNPGTLTGSIGVIMQHPVLAELMKTAKVDMQTYASGGLKDSGSPYRQPTAADRAYLAAVTQEIHGQFVDAVVESRGLPREKVLEVADGRVITGAHAKELGLVDELGTLHDAAQLALTLAGVEGEPELVYPPHKGGYLQDLLSSSAQGMARGVAQAASPGLWRVLEALPRVEPPGLETR